jgi:putative FmdB family regulatory protein
MPLYEYLCPECGSRREESRPIVERDAAVRCLVCKSLCQRVLFPGFSSPRRPPRPETAAEPQTGGNYFHNTRFHGNKTAIRMNDGRLHLGGRTEFSGNETDLDLENADVTFDEIDSDAGNA